MRLLRWQAGRRLTSSIFLIQTTSIRRNGLLFEQEAIERFAAQYGTAQAVCDAVKLPHPGRMNAAFDYAAAVLADEEVPHNAAEAALCGVLAWLQHDGIGFAVYEGFNLMRQIRKLITADMAADWFVGDAGAAA